MLRGSKESLDECERGELRSWLKTQYSENKIMAPCPITSWQIDGEKKETMTDVTLLGSKITAEGNCSHEIKRHLLLGRKAVISLDSLLESNTLVC